jgi:hypothetical protein
MGLAAAAIDILTVIVRQAPAPLSEVSLALPGCAWLFVCWCREPLFLGFHQTPFKVPHPSPPYIDTRITAKALLRDGFVNVVRAVMSSQDASLLQVWQGHKRMIIILSILYPPSPYKE